MPLTPRQRKHLKALAHKLKPVVQVGNAGVSAAVVEEIGFALAHHELLKIRLPQAERAARAAMFEQICAALRAEPVQTIGRMAVLYRPGDEPRIRIPE